MKELNPDNELSIKVQILDRFYPLTISAGEEEFVRKAARKVNETITEFKGVYAADKQALLAMSALTFAIDLLKGQSKNTEKSVDKSSVNIDDNALENSILEQLEELEQKLSEAI